MGWVRIDDAFYDHPKFSAAGPHGLALWVAALAFANRNLSDGIVTTSQTRRLLDWNGLDADPVKLAEQLADIGLLERVDGGYRIHDYLNYQKSADQVRSERVRDRHRKRNAGEVGLGIDQVSSPAVPDPPDDTPSNGQPTDSARIPDGSPPDSERPQPQPSPNGEKRASSSSLVDRHFDAVWNDYPNKVAKKAARRQFTARVRAGVPVEELHRATRNYANVTRGKEKSYIMYPSTFFGRDERWKDYLQQASVNEAWESDPLNPANFGRGGVS